MNCWACRRRLSASVCSYCPVRLREWAAREGVHYQTAWRWWRDGTLPVPARQTETGTILVDVPREDTVSGLVVVYARVS